MFTMLIPKINVHIAKCSKLQRKHEGPFPISSTGNFVFLSVRGSYLVFGVYFDFKLISNHGSVQG